MRRIWKGVQGLLVVVGVVILTSFTIDATDTLRGSSTAFSSLVGTWAATGCPAGTTELALADKNYCIDTYENSTTADCPATTPRTDAESKTNIDTADCQSASVATAQPWTAATFHQAKALCAKRGMRLPTPDEWYEAALGTPADERCVIDARQQQTGSKPECQSYRGAYDMVGNVWEWVDGQVQDGMYNNRSLPAEGYVTASAADGIATETSLQADQMYDGAYFWQDPAGEYVMMRGGFYGSGADASVYTTHAKVTASFHSDAIGFRCIVEM